MIEKDLGPCPFCECDEVVIGSRPREESQFDDDRWEAQGICWRCLSTGPIEYGATREEAMDRARKRWLGARICRIEDVRDNPRTGDRTFVLSCGHERKGRRGDRFNYCEVCGARVADGEGDDSK